MMNREIKFRAWDRENKRMLPFLEFTKKDSFIVEHRSDFDASFPVSGFHISDVMQYTGLKDKNGKEIYEGDIIEFPTFYETPEMSHNPPLYAPICFSDACFTFCDEPLSQDEIDNNETFNIVGNIHENPELL